MTTIMDGPEIRMGRGEWYESVIARRLAAGEDVLAPARYVISLAPKSVLDVGCGSGHLARELFEHGIDVVGVDIDPEMIETARRLGPQIDWIRADVASLRLGQTFDVVLVAGNVLNFVAAPRVPEAILCLCLHVGRGGRLAASFSSKGAIRSDHYDRICAEQGMVLSHRWSDWSGTALSETAADVIVIHQRLQ